MEKRYFLFVLLSALILFSYLSIASLLAPPRPAQVAEFDEEDPLADEALLPEADPLDPEMPPDPVVDPDADPADRPDPAVPDPAVPDLAVPDPDDAQIGTRAPDQWLTLGSGTGTPYPLLASFTNRGAALQRIELTTRGRDGSLQYRDVTTERGYLGRLQLEDATDGGVRVQVVGDGTPAALAVSDDPAIEGGLRPGDVIGQLNETPIHSLADWERLLAATRPGAEVRITVRRTEEDATELLQFAVRLGEQPLEIVAPEVTYEAGIAITDPPSLLLTIARLGREDGRLLNLEERRGQFPSLADVVWDVQHLDGPDPGLEFSYTLSENDLQQVGMEGQWQIVKRFRLSPLPETGSAAPGHLPYHLKMDIALRNLGEQTQRIAYHLTGPNGLPTEGWWYQNKIHPQMMAGTGARDVLWDSVAEGHRLLGSPKIYSNAQSAAKEGRSLVTSIASASDPEPRRLIRNMGVDTQYFVVALIPGTLDEPQPMLVDEMVAYPVGGIRDMPKAMIRTVNVSFAFTSPTFTVEPRQEISQSFVVFAGPKEAEVLASYAISESLEYGWRIIEMFARPLGAILHLFARIPPYNYGLAIIMLTVLVRACMMPISRKAAKSAAKMQELAPELKKISEKYKEDLPKQRLAQQELYRKHNFNPFGSCLLMFFQLPVFIGLYRCLSIDIELRQAPLIPGIDWASNLSAPDMLFRWDGFMPQFIAGEGTGWLGPYFNILPVITIVLFVVQQKMFTPPPTDEQQKAQQQMMTFMMVFMGVLFFKVPSGLCLYFIVSSLWGITERKMLPKPTPPGESVPEKKTPSEPGKSKWSLGGDGQKAPPSKPSARKKQKRR